MIFEVGRGGGASGKLVHLLITCDSSIAGATVTAVNGTESYTATAPSGGGLITFDCKALGTWTVSESEYSSSTDIEAQYYGNYELSVGKPDGSTVTPTDDISTWLKCATLSSNYTTLNQVLADNTVLLALISDENAVNYMVRSTTRASSVCANSTAMTYIGNNDNCADTLLADSTWRTAICNSSYYESVLNVKVPNMTSNTAPSGTASSDNTKMCQPYLAFNTSQQYENQQGSPATWIKYDFGKSVIVNKIFIKDKSSGMTKTGMAVSFQASADNSTWDTLYSTSIAQSAGKEYNFVVNAERKPYRYFRLYTTDYCVYYNGTYRVSFEYMNFYGREA